MVSRAVWSAVMIGRPLAYRLLMVRAKRAVQMMR